MNRRLSLRQRLYVLTAVALLPAVFLLAYNQTVLRQARVREVHQSALRIAEQSSLEIQRIVDGAQSVLLTLARAPSVRSFNAALCVPYLSDITKDLPQFTAIAVIDRTGVLRCRGAMPTAEVNVSDRIYFKEVMAHGGFYVGTYQKSLVDGKALLPLAYPIRGDDQSITGVIVAGLDVAWLNKLVNNRPFGPDDALTVADRNGVIFARHPLADRFIGTKIPDAFMPMVLAPTSGTVELTSQDGTRRITGYIPVNLPPGGIYVSAGIGADNAMEQVRNATQRGIAAIVIGAALAFLFAALIGKSLIREPLEHIIRTVERWRKGDTYARTGMARDNEIALVGSAMDAFIDDLERSRRDQENAEQQRALLHGELEHRVKNTLATVRAIAGQTFKGAAMKPALDLFTGRIMAIAHAYDQLRSEKWQSADLEGTVRTVVMPFNASKFEIDGPALHINSKATLALSLVLHELATNAAKYGALKQQNGMVSISWHLNGPSLNLDWRERDGPAVTPPTTSGFGTRLIEQMLRNDLGAEVSLEFREQGLECQIVAPLSRMEHTAS